MNRLGIWNTVPATLVLRHRLAGLVVVLLAVAALPAAAIDDDDDRPPPPRVLPPSPAPTPA